MYKETIEINRKYHPSGYGKINYLSADSIEIVDKLIELINLKVDFPRPKVYRHIVRCQIPTNKLEGLSTILR